MNTPAVSPINAFFDTPVSSGTLIDIIDLFEPASSGDGFNASGDGVYYLSRAEAEKYQQERHGVYGCGPIMHAAVARGDGRYLILKSTRPVSLVGSKQSVEDIVNTALAKLSDEERAALATWKDKQP